jgi:pimeloyl-ACP methyl ester carboxylesterase
MRGGEAESEVAASFYNFASGHKGNDLEALACCIVGLERDLDRSRLARITVPILVVVGDRDELVSGAHELVEQIPTSRLMTIPGRDHLGTVQAREFKQAALEFLD